MTAPVYSAKDFLSALHSLLPRGRVWPRESESTQSTALSGLTPVYERNSRRANDLLNESLPSSTYQLLPEWEATLGLPDPCAGVSPTIQQRRGQVVARFSNRGGQSAEYFISQAASLGYQVSVREYAPFRCGHSRCGDSLGNSDWFFTWAIVSQSNTVIHFRAGQSSAGEPLAIWQNTVLECELNRIKPAHTILNFIYEV